MTGSSRIAVCGILAGLCLWVSSLRGQGQTPAFMPIDDVKPGQVGIGRTVFAGETIEEFKVNILGVLRNIIGPKRDLILARLEGGPLATTGVIQGMSGSPVYIDGKLVGAVSYALGSFPREPIAGITPIAEMIDAVDNAGPRASGGAPLEWPATQAEVFTYIGKLADRAAAALRPTQRDFGILGPTSLADLVPSLRPIGVAMVVSGLDPALDPDLRRALVAPNATNQTPNRTAPARSSTLRGGDAVGMSLVRGDLDLGATGTVTYVNAGHVYAFGHPFLNLGPAAFPMTDSHVYAILPSLDSSLKIATLGSVIGTMSQDRATAVGGILGAGPSELRINMSLSSERGGERTFSFRVIRDQMLTPLFAYVSVLNALAAYERQSGVLSISATGTTSFGADGSVTIDDAFTGETALTAAATALTAPIAAAAANDFRSVLSESLDVRVRTSEQQANSVIERVWLDTTRPHYGETHNVQVQLRDYRGASRTIAIPITMPDHAQGPLTLLVGDAPTLSGLEQRELRPGKATNWSALLTQLNNVRRNNRLYVRLISSGAGTVVGGETLPGLPAGVRSVLDTDPSVASSSVTRAVIGTWEQKLDRVVRGSREIPITLTAKQ